MPKEVRKVKVRILRPDPRTAVSLGYSKGRVVEIDPTTAKGWIDSKYAEAVDGERTAAPATNRMVQSATTRTRRRAG